MIVLFGYGLLHGVLPEHVGTLAYRSPYGSKYRDQSKGRKPYADPGKLGGRGGPR